jgi:hypothetical protein
VNKTAYIQELKCEPLIRKLYGSQWRNLDERERDGAIGIAIVKSVMDGVKPDIQDISRYLGVNREYITNPFKRLFMNGVFLRDKISKDKGLRNGDIIAWGYYAGYAMGATGPWKES